MYGAPGVRSLGVILSLLWSAAAAGQMPNRASTAEQARLVFSTQQPRAAEVVRAEYRPLDALAAEDSLVLRAQYFTAEPPLHPQYTRVATLHRAGASFRGGFQLPDSVVYAVFSVESVPGDRVDTDLSTWELRVVGTEGNPLLSALERQHEHLQQRDQRRAPGVARLMSTLYPDSVAGWAARFRHEHGGAPAASRDSVRAAFSQRFQMLERRMESAGKPAPGEMRDMVFFATALQDTAATRKWRTRLVQDFPTHPDAVQQRVFELTAAHRGDRGALNGALERLWAEVGGVSPQLAFTAFLSARVAADTAALRRWGPRLEARPELRPLVASTFLLQPALHEDGIPRARMWLRQLDRAADEDRPLQVTRLEHERELARGKAFALGQLGRALLARGRDVAALDTLERAVSTDWNVELFREIASLRLSAGDTAAALPILARIAADPTTSPAFADSVWAQMGARLDPARWAEWTVRGREEMLSYVAGRLTDRALPRPLQVGSVAGERTVVRAEAGQPVVVALWSRYCAPSLETLKDLNAMAAELGRRKIPLVTITDEAPSPGLAAFLARNGYEFPVSHDPGRSAAGVLGRFATPMYLILDADNHVRFESHGIRDVIRSVEVLRSSWGDKRGRAEGR